MWTFRDVETKSEFEEALRSDSEILLLGSSQSDVNDLCLLLEVINARTITYMVLGRSWR